MVVLCIIFELIEMCANHNINNFWSQTIQRFWIKRNLLANWKNVCSPVSLSLMYWSSGLESSIISLNCKGVFGATNSSLPAWMLRVISYQICRYKIKIWISHFYCFQTLSKIELTYPAGAKQHLIFASWFGGAVRSSLSHCIISRSKGSNHPLIFASDTTCNETSNRKL